MLELNPFRKNKVNLEDYDYQRDIQNRLMMASFTEQDLQVLNEILYGHPKISIAQLAQDLIFEESDLINILTKLSQTGLFCIKDHAITLNKEMRKYFEAQLLKFEEGFVPGMEYLQTLLRKVPFHVLLSWYPIPRTSNNIFDSLVEKYLLTPQIFQRYLMELNFGNPKISSIVSDVYNAPDFKMLGTTLKKKYDLSSEEFEEILLHLEFNFVCCLTYKKIAGAWEQVVSPFYEWREYLKFVRDHKPQPLEKSHSVQNYRNSDFAFTEDMTTLLQLIKTSPFHLLLDEQERWMPDKVAMKLIVKHLPSFNPHLSQTLWVDYLGALIHKLLFLKLCRVDGSVLKTSEGCEEWLSLSIENRALAIYKHTILKLEQETFSPELATDRAVREIEKTMIPVVHLDWICFDDFMKSIAAPMSKENKIVLKKVGKGWKYVLPQYSEQEARLIKKTVLEWFFEAGLVSIGYFNETPAFRVTPFGQTIFT